jgi:hypothetical protein
MPVRHVLFQRLSEEGGSRGKALQLLNVGHACRFGLKSHTRLSTIWKEQLEEGERRHRGHETILQTLQESTLRGSPAALKMKKIAKRQNKRNQSTVLQFKALVRYQL